VFQQNAEFSLEDVRPNVEDINTLSKNLSPATSGERGHMPGATSGPSMGPAANASNPSDPSIAAGTEHSVHRI